MSPEISYSDSLASVIFGVIVLISKRGVTHTVGTYDPRLSRTIHTKFYFN